MQQRNTFKYKENTLDTMVFIHKDYANKFGKCKYKNQAFCVIYKRMIEDPIDMIGQCGNCRANTEEPNLF
jgi:hypothetical protein